MKHTVRFCLALSCHVTWYDMTRHDKIFADKSKRASPTEKTPWKSHTQSKKVRQYCHVWEGERRFSTASQIKFIWHLLLANHASRAANTPLLVQKDAVLWLNSVLEWLMVLDNAGRVCWNSKVVISEIAIVRADGLLRPLTPRLFLADGHSRFKQWCAPFMFLYTILPFTGISCFGCWSFWKQYTQVCDVLFSLVMLTVI